MTALEIVAAEEESIEAASAPTFSMATGVVVEDEETADDLDDEIALAIVEALKRYRRGHWKASMAALCDAMNDLADREKIYGGAWI